MRSIPGNVLIGAVCPAAARYGPLRWLLLRSPADDETTDGKSQDADGCVVVCIFEVNSRLGRELVQLFGTSRKCVV